MIGIGIDILELRRIREARYLLRVAEYFLTPDELKEFNTRQDKTEFLASRFAAKEAVIKAFPMQLSPCDFKISKSGKKPTVHFFAPQHRRYEVLISISHSIEYVASFAVVLKHT